MRFNSLLLIFSCLLYINVLEAGSPDSTKNYPFIKGTKALQFRISSVLSLSSFQGSLISYQKQLSSEKARRIGISISSNISWGEGSFDEIRYSVVDTSYDTTDYELNRNKDNLKLSITIQHIKYKSLNEGFYFYRGIGPILGVVYNDRDNKSSSKSGNRSRSISKQFNIGICAVLGVEWFIKNNLSLLAEYRPTITIGYKYRRNYSKSYYSNRWYEKDEIVGGPTFNLASGVKFGLSIYL